MYCHLFVIRITNYLSEYKVMYDRDTIVRYLESYTTRFLLMPLNDRSSTLQTHLIAPI